jgi:hypothetical protein
VPAAPRVADDAREPEVGYLQEQLSLLVIERDKEVCGLHISVDNTPGVYVIQRLAELAGELAGRGIGDPSRTPLEISAQNPSRRP